MFTWKKGPLSSLRHMPLNVKISQAFSGGLIIDWQPLFMAILRWGADSLLAGRTSHTSLSQHASKNCFQGLNIKTVVASSCDLQAF
ncbi:Hypothetical predicted protein [Podarcis lilfordi]|uniref:Uncharacterized protein n=1 Tax=Podarcis lilfordi TaxID=74358 RepID=A0AA35PEE7_9SAUR|nr:Hypothetical predicted protein [Podarcis lilfordi]